jgi:threonine dehydrogenase-like Zn-dependent dehydrogenase
VGGERRNASPAHNRGMSKQILIVGCGAIGGLFAAALSSAARVTVLDTNAEARAPPIFGQPPNQLR